MPRWTLQYAERSRGDTGNYVVTDGISRFSFLSKTEAIADVQFRNGWQVDGNERNYAAQVAAESERDARRPPP